MSRSRETAVRRTKIINNMKAELRRLLPQVLADSALSSEQSLNGVIGCKADEFIDLKNDIIYTPEQYVTQYMDGLKNICEVTPANSKYNIFFSYLKSSPSYRDYLHIFLRRAYLKHQDGLIKRRPEIEQSYVWMGQNKAEYGLYITPRYVGGMWENDVSEIRRFKPRYWSIGHVLATGLVVPNSPKKISFSTLDQYLTFFESVLVRQTGSLHQERLAAKYCEYVRSFKAPENVPLLIPEYRYGGVEKAHKYRLDFTIIHPVTMDKVGFEISPWSVHGALKGTKKKTQAQINKEAYENFNREIEKQKQYFWRYGITVLIYSDDDIGNGDFIFSEMVKYLSVGDEAPIYSYRDFNSYFS